MLFLTLFLLVFFSILSFFNFIKLKSDYLFYFLIIFLVCLESIKCGSGTDYFFYYNDYHNYYNVNNYTSRYEPFYSFISKLAVTAEIPFNLFLLIYYLIYYFLVGYTIKKNSPYPFLSLFLFFCLSIGLMGSNRQLMATAIIFFVTFYFFRFQNSIKNYFYFLFFIIIACSFHYSALLAVPIILFNNKISNRLWFFVFFIAIIFLVFNVSSFLIFSIDDFVPTCYSILIEKYKLINSSLIPLNYLIIFGVIRRLILVILLYKFQNEFKTIPIFILLYNISWFSLVFYVFFYTLPFIGSRASVYFIIFESISYALLLYYLKQKQTVFFIFIILFALFLFVKNISLYPQLFIPYQTIFGTF